MPDYTPIKHLILKRIDELIQTRSETAPVELDQSRVGRLSRMDALQIQQMGMESERRRSAELLKLNTALQQLETDEFGTCIACGEDINIKRLAVDPVASHCIDCANKLERS